MSYKYICDLYCVYNIPNQAGVKTHYSITPLNKEGMTFREVLNRYAGDDFNIPYWIYVNDRGIDTVYKGVIQTIYKTWGIFQVSHSNNLQQYDFLYAYNHKEHLIPNSIGILYELT